MKISTLVTGAACIAGAAAAATPSLCDKYTTALFGKDDAVSQMKLLHRLVNTAVIGNYLPNPKNQVAGILTPGTYNGEHIKLVQYFDGTLASTNNGGKCGVSVNFLDGGGAAALMQNKAAFDKTSNQFFLLTHLYKFFASLLGCSKFGNTVKPYDGTNGMYKVHKFMALDPNQVGYFIQQVGLAATSLGVTQSDAAAVGTALMNLFGYRCLPPASIPSFESPALQSICTDCSCPLAPSPDCGDYGPVIQPKLAKDQKPGWCGSQEWRDSWMWCGKHH